MLFLHNLAVIHTALKHLLWTSALLSTGQEVIGQAPSPYNNITGQQFTLLCSPAFINQSPVFCTVRCKVFLSMQTSRIEIRGYFSPESDALV
ncbi:hypothetical protein PoB_007344400 [Plakobranchus ocellatus]|uniref:Secreted protein n=1 Tax=Plakobranchus ocellatus TaxID=259542 RepID=A0AAV4DS09_9GAST|nr:hypothetical protein PoB_007344400 [Plakobranchus ocellatus]